MSLLETITRAVANAESVPKTPNDYPIVLNPDSIFPLLNSHSATSYPIQRVTGWNDISHLDSQLIQLSHRFFKKLSRKLKNPDSFTCSDFFLLLNSFLDNLREMLGLSVGLAPSDPDYPHRSIEQLGFFIGRDVAKLLSQTCVALHLWDLLETLIVQDLVSPHCQPSDMVENLIAWRASHTLCLYTKHVADIPPSELILILNYFLMPPKGVLSSMITVRQEWESQVLSVMEQATKGSSTQLSKKAAVLLAAAYDGFTLPELCLHYLFGSKNAEGLAVSSAVAGLGRSEMLRLVRYLGKWLRKYERFPEASVTGVQGLESCRCVPSLESIMRCIGLVFDEHFSSLVLCTEFHEELRWMESVVRTLELEASLCCTIANTINNLKLDAKLTV